MCFLQRVTTSALQIPRLSGIRKFPMEADTDCSLRHLCTISVAMPFMGMNWTHSKLLKSWHTLSVWIVMSRSTKLEATFINQPHSVRIFWSSNHDETWSKLFYWSCVHIMPVVNSRSFRRNWCFSFSLHWMYNLEDAGIDCPFMDGKSHITNRSITVFFMWSGKITSGNCWQSLQIRTRKWCLTP